MDGLIGLGIVFFVFQLIAKAAKNAEKAGKTGKAAQTVGEIGKGIFSGDDMNRKMANLLREELGWEGRPETVPASARWEPPTPMVQEGDSMMLADSGNMNFVSTEGMDLCDHALGHGRTLAFPPEEEPDTEPETALEWSLSFTPDAMVQGIIMNEILTRPAQRKWGKR